MRWSAVASTIERARFVHLTKSPWSGWSGPAVDPETVHRVFGLGEPPRVEASTPDPARPARIVVNIEPGSVAVGSEAPDRVKAMRERFLKGGIIPHQEWGRR